MSHIERDPGAPTPAHDQHTVDVSGRSPPDPLTTRLAFRRNMGLATSCRSARCGFMPARRVPGGVPAVVPANDCFATLSKRLDAENAGVIAGIYSMLMTEWIRDPVAPVSRLPGPVRFGHGQRRSPLGSNACDAGNDHPGEAPRSVGSGMARGQLPVRRSPPSARYLSWWNNSDARRNAST